MFITGCGTAVPPDRYTQKQCWETLRASAQFQTLSSRSQAILRKVFLGDNGIDSRHLALNPLEEAFLLNPDALQARFARTAPALASRAAGRALHDANLGVGDVDAILVSTCTGYLCPGLTSYVTETLGLRADVFALDLVGQGCGAAIPNLRAAEALIASGRAQNVLSVCVEVCSAAFYLDDDPGVLVSACLFGDGAGSLVLSSTPGKRLVEWLGAGTVLDPSKRDLLRFEHKHGMLRNILDKTVPDLIRGPARDVLERTLARLGYAREDVGVWIMHAGGREILRALAESLELTEEDLAFSSQVLRQFGNLSSPCVFFALKAALDAQSAPGLWWMSSFGAGFSCHGALLRVGRAMEKSRDCQSAGSL